MLIGYEPGEQAAGGKWEGNKTDLAVAEWVAANHFGGAFIWAINPSPTTNPDGAQLAPRLATAIAGALKPGWPYVMLSPFVLAPKQKYIFCEQCMAYCSIS